MMLVHHPILQSLKSLKNTGVATVYYSFHYTGAGFSGLSFFYFFFLPGTTESLLYLSISLNGKRGSSVVSALASGSRGPGSIPPRGEENFGVRTHFP